MAAGAEAIRGWQTDQDIFDDAAADVRRSQSDRHARHRHRPASGPDERRRDRDRGPPDVGRRDRGHRSARERRLRAPGAGHETAGASWSRSRPALDDWMRPVFGPLAEEGFAEMAQLSDAELEFLVDFMERVRATYPAYDAGSRAHRGTGAQPPADATLAGSEARWPMMSPEVSRWRPWSSSLSVGNGSGRGVRVGIPGASSCRSGRTCRRAACWSTRP